MKTAFLLFCCTWRLIIASRTESSALDHAEKARQLTVASKYQEANAEWKEALRLAPENAIFHNLYGLALQESGQPALAQTEFRKALRLKANFAEAHSNLAFSLWESHDYEGANTEVSVALRLSPKDAPLHFLRGEVLARSVTPGSACREFGLATPWPKEPASIWEIFESCLIAHNRPLSLQAADSLPANAETQLTVGKWLLGSDEAAAAVRYFGNAARDESLRGEATVLLSEAYLASCKPEKALDALDHLGEAPAFDYQVQDLRGSTLSALGRLPEAEKEFTRLIEDYSNVPDAYVAATQIAIEQKRWDDALAILNAGLVRMPRNWLLLLRRGMVYKLKGQADQARTDLLAALRADGDVALVTAALGDLSAESGDLPGASELFRQTWERTKLPQFLLAYALALDRLGKFRQSLEQLDKLLQEYPANGQAHYTKGKILARNNSLSEAQLEFETVRQIDPGFSSNLYALAHVYLQQGEREQAKKALGEFQRAKQQIRASSCKGAGADTGR